MGKHVADNGMQHDRGDAERFFNHRNRDYGYLFGHEFYQVMPLLFNQDGNPDYAAVGNYRGATAFLIGGGPSFAEIDTSKLSRCYTMTMNNSVKNFRSDSWISVDDPSRFIASCWLDPKITKYVPFGCSDKPLWDSRVINGKQVWGPLNKKVGDCPNVYYYRRNGKFHANRFLWESTINWGNTKKFGGNRSVMLPALRILWILGFRKIYLLGVDLDMKPEARYHFDDGRTKEGVGGNRSTYKKMQDEYFPKLQTEFKKFGLEVYQCNPNSNLKVFDHVSFDDAVADATFDLGDPSLERTQGMYRTYGEKVHALPVDKKALAEELGDDKVL